MTRTVRASLVVLLLLSGGGVFAWTFSRSLAAVPAANYTVRDDAVVTLSHARNLVDYGFIGVSPSGERIEGFSNPLQFWVGVVFYATTKADFRTFFRLQTAIGTVLLGVVFAGFLSASFPVRRGSWYRFVFIAGALAGSAAILASSRVFLLWHASGMENVYKSVLLIALLWSLDAMLRKGRIQWAAGALVLAASLARIDSILAVGALLSVFAALWWLRYRNDLGVRFVVVSLMPWVLYMAWRRWYFGDWMPNTAIAQGISVSHRVANLWQASRVVWTDWSGWAQRVVPTLHGFQLAWMGLLLPFVGLHRLALERCALLLAGVTAGLAHYLFFGTVRLDEARTVTELAIYATAATPLVLLAVDDFRLKHVVTGLLVIACSTGVAVRRLPDRNEIGWGIEWFEQNADQAAALAKEHSIPRPTFANADLGAPSWRKQFNMIDIGLLGSAMTPRVAQVGRYVAEVAKPDIIEIHDAWSCLYRDLFTNPTFIAEYAPVAAERSDWLKVNCTAEPQAMRGVWLRRDVMRGSGTPERAFIDSFQRSFSPDALREELFKCARVPGERPCAYVGRTLFRFVPELKARKVYSTIAAMLSHDPRLAIDHAYFTSSVDPTWWKVLLRSERKEAAQTRFATNASAGPLGWSGASKPTASTSNPK